MPLRKLARAQILIPLLAIAAHLIPGPRTIDDAYITFRYARNLISGTGLVFNPGEHVLGTTTPLYSLLMAGLALVTGGAQAPFPILAWALNALAAAAGAYLLILLGASLGSRRAGLAAAAVWAVAPMSVTFAIGGMETSLFIALMLATLYLHLSERPVAAAAFAALSLLTRPDALLFLLPLALERLRRSLPAGRLNPAPLRITAREATAFLIPVGTWAVFATLYYGNPIPHSILAKTQAYLLPQEAGLVRLLQHYATPFLGHLLFGVPWIGVGLVAYPILYGLGALRALRARPDSWAVLAFPWVYLAAFAIANPLIFRWYLAPPLPLYFLGIFLGAERLGSDLRRPALIVGLASAAFVMTLNGWTLSPDHGPSRPAPEMAYIKLELLYEQVARDLKDSLLPGQVLAAGDVGALGYFTQARILDTVGLISPQSLAYYPQPRAAYVINYAIPAALVLDQQPDYLVILEVYGRNTLLQDRAFRAAYTLTRTLDTDIYGSQGMLVFRRSPPRALNAPAHR